MCKARIPAANGHCSARALAKFYAALAAGGTLPGGRSILSSGAVSAMHDIHAPRSGNDGGGNSHTWTAGFKMFDFGAKMVGIGYPGIGGSIGFCSQEYDFAVGITVNRLSLSPIFGEDGITEQLVELICTELEIPVPSNLQKPPFFSK